MTQPANIQHPTSIGVQNKHALDTLTIAYACALGLAGNGYTVLSVLVAHHRPVIWIQPSLRCEALGGVEYKRESTPAGQQGVMQANVNGCRVQWTVVH